MAQDLIIVETRRSKGVHKADLTTLSKEKIQEILKFYNSNSYVALKNYRTDCMEIKFERMGARGLVNYNLKTSLTDSDFEELKFIKTPKGNWHLTQEGCSISRFDIEVKEPVKKITSRKKEEKSSKVKTEKGKTPLPPTKSKEVKTEKKVKTALPENN